MQTISQFTIDTSKKYLHIPQMLTILGYSQREKDWIRKTENGRYHAIVIGRDINVHFDVDTLDGRHMTLPSLVTLQTEKKQMLKYLFKQSDYKTKKNYNNKKIFPEVSKSLKKQTTERSHKRANMFHLVEMNLTGDKKAEAFKILGSQIIVKSSKKAKAINKIIYA